MVGFTDCCMDNFIHGKFKRKLFVFVDRTYHLVQESRGIAVEIDGLRALGPNDFMQNGETRIFTVAQDGSQALSQDRLSGGRVSVEAWGVDWHEKEISDTRGSWLLGNPAH